MGTAESSLRSVFKASLGECSKGIQADDCAFLQEVSGFVDFVKGKGQDTPAGKHGNLKELPFLSFALRSLAIYVADVVAGLKLECQLQMGPDKENVMPVLSFLKHVEAAQDIDRCGEAGKELFAEPLAAVQKHG